MCLFVFIWWHGFMLAFSAWRNFFSGEIKRAPEYTLPRPRRPGILRTPPHPRPPHSQMGGGWVLAVSSGLFFVVARDAKKNERRNAETGGEKREEGEAESRLVGNQGPIYISAPDPIAMR